MNIFAKSLSAQPQVKSLVQDIQSGRLPAVVTGLGHIHKLMLAHALCATTDRKAIFVVGDEAEAARMLDDLRALGERAVLFPAQDLALRPMESVSREYEQQRLGVLAQVLSGDCDAVVLTADALARYTLPPSVLTASTITLTAGKPLPMADITTALVGAGYERCDQVEAAGQFAVRGGIIDVFPADSPAPVRMELWGDTVDTLNYFDRSTQRRTEAVDSVSIPPATEILCPDTARLAGEIEQLASAQRGKLAAQRREVLTADMDRLRGGSVPVLDKYLSMIYPERSTLLDYAPDALWFVSEWSKVKERLRTFHWQLQQDIEQLLSEGELCPGMDDYALDTTDLAARLEQRATVFLDSFARSIPDVRMKELYDLHARQLPVWSGGMDILIEDIQDFLHRKLSVVVLAGGRESAAQALAEDLAAKGIPALYAPSPETVLKSQVLVLCGGLSSGAEFPDAGVVFISHGKTTAVHRPHKRRKRDKAAEIHSLNELTVGDYVVHSVHGIGVYQGVHPVEMQGVIKDYIKISYAKGDTLYVPVTQLDLVSKYIGTQENIQLRLHRLGGQEWQKTKTRVRAAVKDIAKQLIKLYSTRMATQGYAFGPDEEWQFDFERRFEFDETDDQLQCAAEIKSDMERSVPMDRLLCGDVGFGKTEVALRAAFKCVTEGKQCALLVPTTILAYQHYNTILKRFDGFPVRIQMLSRFRSAKEQTEIVRQLRHGEIDIIVGTHRLLSSDIRFKDLGLFIVDEEQRFGVAQKERIKELTPAVDVLTLSATPIPRTLNMAMSGIRDMSVLEEAPQDRRPVQTYVLEHDNGVLADAIRRELRRGGQVYYLHNRVEDIERVAASWQLRVPEAKVGFAHGKMTEEELSDIWRRVLDQEIDLLVCTTIIETGVDISNVNTLIIEHADRFGLSQLHQLRGRVGRSSRRAFAYLTFVRGKVLSDVAEKRLQAMREFTEFGAGFRIAMRDMEIRGAGNLLGAQQHGHMESVGYDMYLRLLADAVDEEKTGTGKRPEQECLIDLPVSAHIPDSYIPTPAGRLDMYRHIADIRTFEDSLDVYDELIDRYGEPPETVQGLVEVALLRSMAAGMGIYEVKQNAGNVLLYMTAVDMELTARMSGKLPGRVLLNAGPKPYISVRPRKSMTLLDTLREALEAGQPEAPEPAETSE